MEYSFFDFLTLVGSLGMFLYGMKIMSEGLQKVAGDKMRSILSAMTTNRFTGVLTGVLITALIQSSSATTVMVVSFVNAGLLTLTQSISVIMGANVGTTVTAWIISLFGFKVDISLFALPLVGLALPLVFSQKSKRKSWGEFIIGFALLFLGLSFLKENVPDLQKNPEALAFLQNYTNLGYPSLFIFLALGSILTVIVQSSSATVAITLIMCTKGWIPFEMAAAMILGENIGTTITANLAAFSANVSAKRAALAHLMFNVFGVFWVLLLFYPFTSLVSWIVTNYGPGNPNEITNFLATLDSNTIAQITSGQELTDPKLLEYQSQLTSLQVSVSYGLSLFHTLFNICNVCIMIWFVKFYVYICSALIKPRKEGEEEEFQLTYITSSMLSTSELSMMQAKKEIAVYGDRTYRMLGMVRQLFYEKNEEEFLNIFNRIVKYENICDRMEIEIANYLTLVSEGRLSSESKEEIRVMLRAVTEIESVADSCHNLARGIKRRNEGKSVFTDELNHNFDYMLSLVDKALAQMNNVLHKIEIVPDDINPSYNLENEINNYRNQLKLNNLEDVNNKKYDYQDGVYYIDLISECEKMGDYIINVMQAIVEKKS
ncbi:phosphate:Na+ symporter [Parabacteroides sp. PF5-5]|uniref:Na/Pi cotransporter family protein n=1 Tax=unclassified Parabacteroides TaxID=2649774 RepID=UPI0024736B8D|nr:MULTISPECIES: Na/Pi cotransporter family protein [unclassified Parabacteroides]MDH6305947.1 phosphate:Na+ symporter [Parabacteroides sp. PH5-39]MDH6317203.1 phosphate:Na+ symporter [Parabacteroides sp. PF5-13]MDH6320659.1 phosphate:Na+ symporter [Parabacteroides sp. PH5-13]MDH6324420.1 phosphate:Na+ symporter [Parabacteroides sp. PH5-8]MDH6328388.1 phosphate:Na+ symporter [Parabacteroides sp. PH5-41]